HGRFRLRSTLIRLHLVGAVCRLYVVFGHLLDLRNLENLAALECVAFLGNSPGCSTALSLRSGCALRLCKIAHRLDDVLPLRVIEIGGVGGKLPGDTLLGAFDETLAVE